MIEYTLVLLGITFLAYWFTETEEERAGWRKPLSRPWSQVREFRGRPKD